jgi:5'-nucleotidase
VRILVTNDDGVDSVGIQRLALALAEAGHDVLVVAPADDRSGTGASLGGFDPRSHLETVAVELPEAPGVEAWALEAPPAMCVLAARLGGFGEPPGFVVSGVNAGLNTGRAILHSGTVGAVLTGQNFGVSGLAVSVQTPADGDQWHWDTAAALTVEVLPLVLAAPERSGVNLNVPARPRAEVAGVRWAKLAPFGEVRAAMVAGDAADENGRRRLQMELQLTEHEFDPESDSGLVRDGYAALTALVGIVEAWPDEEGLAPGGPEVVERLVPGAPLHEAHRVPDASASGTLRRPLIVGP